MTITASSKKAYSSSQTLSQLIPAIVNSTINIRPNLPIFYTVIPYNLINIFLHYRAELTIIHVPEAPFVIVANSEEVFLLYLRQ